jgi:hypothetical protein
MIAARHLEHPARIGIHALFYIFHPRAIDADRYVVFCLARHRARMAANALAIINDKSVSQTRPFVCLINVLVKQASL